MSELPKAVHDCHDLLVWLIPRLDHFPRNRRFTLGERIESGLLDVLEDLTHAAYARSERARALSRANRRLQVVRHLWRLAHELEVVGLRHYGHGAELLTTLGRQIGGWQRQADASLATPR